VRNINVDDVFQTHLKGPQLDFVRKIWMDEEIAKEAQIKKAVEETGLSEEQARGALQVVVKALEKNVEDLHSLKDGCDKLIDLRETFRSIKQMTISECLRNAERDMPVLYKMAYHRKFEVPGGYGAPRRFAVAAMYSMWDLSEFKKEVVDIYPVLNPEPDKKKNHHAGKVCASVIEKGVPTYFVSRSIMQALMDTDLPKDFDLEEMPWPMEAMLLCLPEGSIVTEKGDFSVIAVSRCSDREYFTGWMNWGEMQRQIETEKPRHEGSDAACIMAISDKGHLIQWECPIEKVSIWDASVTKTIDSDLSTMVFTEGVQGTEVQDIPRAVFQIILAMLACPEMVEEGVLIREEKIRKGKPESALWRPNFFGRGYRKYEAVIGDPGDSSRRTRMHWRRGHFRHQRFGRGLAEVRVLWIKPVLINAE
jgi:hypothetical protein